MITGFKDLRIYQKGYDLTLKIYNLARNFPDYERYIICDQIKRAAMSVPLNIAEGYGKKDSNADFKRYLRIAFGSCNEMEVLLDLAFDLGYIDDCTHKQMVNEYIELRKQIYSMIKSWSTEK